MKITYLRPRPLRSQCSCVAALVPVSVVALIGCDSGSDFVTGRRTVDGSGVLAQEARQVGDFTGVSLSATDNFLSATSTVHIDQSGQTSVQVEAEDNLLQHLRTTVRGGILEISVPDGIDLRPTLPIEFDLTVTALDTIVLDGVGDVDAVNLDGQQLNVTLSGVGNVRTSGQMVDQVIRLSGITAYDGSALASTNATVTNNGIGNATVRVSDDLVVHITGQGSVFYIGNPTVTRTGSGVGRVEQISP